MPSTQPDTIRRLVLVRPAAPESRGIRRVLLLDRADHLLPSRRAPATGVRAP